LHTTVEIRFAIKHDITELMKLMLNVPIMRMNNQHQSFGPLVNSTVDYFSTDWSGPSSCSEPVSDGQCRWSSAVTPAAEQCPKLNNPQVQIRWVRWLNKVRNICLQEG